MNPNDRLQARAFLADELYLRATAAEHSLAKANEKITALEKENAVLRGEPNPDVVTVSEDPA